MHLKWVKDYIPSGKDGWKPVIIMVCAALCLTGLEFFSGPGEFKSLSGVLGFISPALVNKMRYWLFDHPDASLHQLIYWGSWSVFLYFIVPACVIKLVLKEKLADYGFKLKGALHGWQLYTAMLLLILPVVVVVSFEQGFRTTYPFYHPPQTNFMGRMMVWEVFYALQFITLEFFFRGFMVHGLKQKMGIYSIVAMMVPYCMIHFSKPLPECIGSIVAGLILGLMSYHYRSVILGACLHITVAITMDFLGLWHRGYFG